MQEEYHGKGKKLYMYFVDLDKDKDLDMARTATHKPRTNKDKVTEFSDLQRENAV